jgi:uridine kinase
MYDQPMQFITHPELEDKIKSLLRENSVFNLGICGLGGSGKSTLCRQLAENSNILHFETDWYARFPTPIRRQRIKEALESGDPQRIDAEENPLRWYDWDALAAGLETLKSTRHLSITDAWNQKTGEKGLALSLELPATGAATIIVDGIYLLHPQIRNQLDMVVHIGTPASTALERSRQRDQHRSSPEYLAYKESLTYKYCVPYFEQYADAIDFTLT